MGEDIVIRYISPKNINTNCLEELAEKVAKNGEDKCRLYYKMLLYNQNSDKDFVYSKIKGLVTGYLMGIESVEEKEKKGKKESPSAVRPNDNKSTTSEVDNSYFSPTRTPIDGAKLKDLKSRIPVVRESIALDGDNYQDAKAVLRVGDKEHEEN